MNADPFEVDLVLAQEPHLSPRHTEMHAVLRVTAGRPAPDDVRKTTLAEVLIIDCSGSMAYPATKLTSAQQATKVAVDGLPDGARFAIVRGDHEASMVYPGTRTLATASPHTRRAARGAIAREAAGGGTAMGSWLTLAKELLTPHTDAVRHALLLTDGHNQHESPEHLREVLGGCTGRFVCDPRGVGDGWDPTELVGIAAALRGTADAVARPEDLAADFQAIVAAAAGKVLPDLRLRITTSASDRLLYCKQVSPSIAVVAGEQAPGDDGPLEFSIGAWGAEAREYHLCFAVTSAGRPMEEDLRVARIDVVADRPLSAAPAQARVRWTRNAMLSNQIDPDVARVTGQQELARAITDGCQAYDRGDEPTARERWGEAVRLATVAGDAAKLENLRGFVRIIDGAAGEVELRPNLSSRVTAGGQLWSLMTAPPPGPAAKPREKSKGTPNAAPPANTAKESRSTPAGMHQVCPACDRPAEPGQNFCHGCGESLAA